jgi:RNA polymerase sigma-70 factor (ECF subfamily)
MNIDSRLLEDFKRGRIDEFYAIVYPSLLSFVTSILGEKNSFLAEDCVQEAIFKTYSSREIFNKPQEMHSYLYRCAHNQAISLLRKDSSQQRYAAQEFEQTEDFSIALIRQETLDLLADAIARLPEPLQEVVHLSYGEGLTNQEIATRLGISESGVKKRKMKLIALLRNEVGDTALLLLLMTGVH